MGFYWEDVWGSCGCQGYWPLVAFLGSTDSEIPALGLVLSFGSLKRHKGWKFTANRSIDSLVVVRIHPSSQEHHSRSSMVVCTVKILKLSFFGGSRLPVVNLRHMKWRQFFTLCYGQDRVLKISSLYFNILAECLSSESSSAVWWSFSALEAVLRGQFMIFSDFLAETR